MRCHEFENRLNTLLDDREDPAADAALAAHARHCRSCEQLLVGHDMLFAGMRQLPVPNLSSGFATAVLARQAQDASLSVTRQPRRLWLAAAVLLTSAAAALLAISFVWQARRGPMPGIALRGDAPEAAQSGSARRGKLAMDQRTAPRRGAAAEGQVALAQSAWLVEATRLTDQVRESIDGLPSTLPETMERINQVEQVAPGIRPLRISFALIWDTICRAFPGGQPISPKEPAQRSGSWLLGIPLIA